jgi:hypothetical protein
MNWVKKMEDDANRAADRAAWKATVIGLIALAMTLALVGPSRSQDRGKWFRSLERPGGGSCCDISDCRKTSAEWRGGKAGQWFAAVNGRIRPIPPEIVLRDPPSIDGDAYVCAGRDIVDDENPTDITLGRLFCFIPPSPGS